MLWIFINKIKRSLKIVSNYFNYFPFHQQLDGLSMRQACNRPVGARYTLAQAAYRDQTFSRCYSWSLSEFISIISSTPYRKWTKILNHLMQNKVTAFLFELSYIVYLQFIEHYCIFTVCCPLARYLNPHIVLNTIDYLPAI